MAYCYQAGLLGAQAQEHHKFDLHAYIRSSLEESGALEAEGGCCDGDGGLQHHLQHHLQQQQQQLHQQQQQQLKQGGPPMSPFSTLAGQQQQPLHVQHELVRPLSRSSWPGVQLLQQYEVEPQDSACSSSAMLSSSWCDGSMMFSSRLSCSTLSMCSAGSVHQLPPLHAQEHSLLLLPHHQQQQQEQHCHHTKQPQQQQHHHHHAADHHAAEQHKQQQQHFLQQHPGLQLQPARSASFSLCSPCCSTASEYGDFAYFRSVDGSSVANSSMLDLSAAAGSAPPSSRCSCATRASSSNSNGSCASQGVAPASPAAGGAAAAAGGGCCCEAEDAAAAAEAAQAAHGGSDGDLGLCRTSSNCSTWSAKSTHVASRPAPGGCLGHGMGWIMPQYGGREVLAEYEFGQTLGCGTFGVTRLVTHRRTARPWACKTICKASIASSPAAQSDVQHEVAILRHLRGHSGIVQLRGVYEDERNIHLVMELCTGGDLLDYISRFGRLGEDEAADVTSVMLSTLAHCHRLGVVHRDIKPENFLLGAPSLLSAPAGTAASVLKISDFGVSAYLQPGECFSEIVGTPFYMAPEVLERCYGHEADVWSAGVVAFLMLAGRLPFDGLTDRQIIKAVLDTEPDFDGPAWAGISEPARDCVRRMLVKDPARRAGIEQLLAHPWLAGRRRSSCCSGTGVDASGRDCRFCGAGASHALGGELARQQQQQQQQRGAAGAGKPAGVSWASPCAVAVETPSPRCQPQQLQRSSSSSSASNSSASTSTSPGASPRQLQLSPLKHCRVGTEPASQ